MPSWRKVNPRTAITAEPRGVVAGAGRLQARWCVLSLRGGQGLAVAPPSKTARRSALVIVVLPAIWRGKRRAPARPGRRGRAPRIWPPLLTQPEVPWPRRRSPCQPGTGSSPGTAPSAQACAASQDSLNPIGAIAVRAGRSVPKHRKLLLRRLLSLQNSSSAFSEAALLCKPMCAGRSPARPRIASQQYSQHQEPSAEPESGAGGGETDAALVVVGEGALDL